MHSAVCLYQVTEKYKWLSTAFEVFGVNHHGAVECTANILHVFKDPTFHLDPYLTLTICYKISCFIECRNDVKHSSSVNGYRILKFVGLFQRPIIPMEI